MSLFARSQFAGAVAAAIMMFASPTILPSPAQAQALPAETFATLPALRGPKLSPSGHAIVARVATGGETVLMIVPLNGSPPSRLPTGDVDVLEYHWVNDDWLVLRVGGETPWQYGGDVYITRVLAVKADGSESQQLLHKFKDLAQHAGDILWVANDGSPRIMMTAQRGWRRTDPNFYPEVYMVEIDKDKASLVSRAYEGVFNWAADNDGNLRMGFGYDWNGHKRRVLYRRSADSGLKEIESGATADDRMVTPDVFLPGDKALAWTRGEDGFYGIYEFDPISLQLGKLVHKVDGYDGAEVVLDPKGNNIIGLGNEESQGTVYWLDERMKKLNADIVKLARSNDVAIVTTNDAMDKVIFRFGTANQPGGYFLYDAATGKASRLGYVNPKLEMGKLHVVQAIRYKARDGLDIEAILTIPTGRSAPMPLIVLPHGGPYARDTVRYDWEAQFLADRGYVVLQPNYRGSAGYGKAFEDAGRGEWGLKMQDDLVDGITELASKGLIDKERVCIVGASYGGYAALRASQRDAEHYRCAASFAGVSDLTKTAKEDRGGFFSGTRHDWLVEQAPDFDSVSPLRTPQATKIPVLLVHGKEDETVDVDQSRDMAKALRDAGKDVTYIEQPEGDHHFSREEDRLQWLKALEAFLAKHNPA